ncbi:MAG TPA: hypothetical protein VFC46_13785, partial [Humisphaera sp.]|nr:hypothetical protein [Humisphaera sp.]
MPTTLLLPAVIATVAIIAIVFALRGRRMDQHPICRRCGFDLFGKPELTKVCGECGSDLNGRRAVRVGRREKRHRLLWVAGMVFLACAGWEGRLGWQAGKSTDWNQHKPVFWLERDVHGKYVPARDIALAELARRIAVGTLPKDREAALLNEAFALQADRTRPWIPGWGTLIEAAQNAH